MRLILHVWRQPGPNAQGQFVRYDPGDVSSHMSLLELLDVVNERLITKGEEPIAFDHDCREGICGMCGMVIDGLPHGPRRATTTCQLHLRMFEDNSEIYIEPWRALALPIIRDLVVDRSALDSIIQAGGFISVRAGSAPDANELLIPKATADLAFDAAVCLGCAACVAACPNASAMLFTAAKVAHLGRLPQGQPERFSRVRRMVAAMDAAGFGGCTNHGECQAVCPEEITLDAIARMNLDLLRATLTGEPED